MEVSRQARGDIDPRVIYLRSGTGVLGCHCCDTSPASKLTERWRRLSRCCHRRTSVVYGCS